MSPRAATRIALVAASWTCVFTGGCSSMRDLAPAVRANQVNVAELTSNIDTLSDLLRPLAEAVWDAEIEARRTVVLDALESFAEDYATDPSRLTAAEVDRAMSRTSPRWGATIDRLTLASGMVGGDAAKMDRLRGQHPVLYDYLTTEISSAKLAEVARRYLDWDDASLETRRALTDGFSHVREAVQRRDASLAALDEYFEVVARQSVLARAHAEIFQFAAESNANVGMAFASVLGDEDLQGRVLGLIQDDRWKASAAEGLDLLKGLTQRPR